MFATVLLGLMLAQVASPGEGVEPIGRLDHPPIREASGLVASRRHPGVFWVHNDSANPPALFAVRRDGSLIREYRVAALNVDWEDIAIDDEGRLYIGDIGNNGHVLPIRVIYRLDEPDPAVEPADEALPATALVVYGFPAGERFDAEGMVVDSEMVTLIEKRLDGREPAVFNFPVSGAGSLLRPAIPAQSTVLKGFTEPVTAADLSPDGRFLAVASLTVTRVYARDADVRWVPVASVSYRADQVEAIAWDGDDLILAGEGRGVYRIAAEVWRGQAARRDAQGSGR